MASLVLSKMSANDCVICADTYTDFKRKKVGCGFCQFECCIECIKTYLLTQTALPHCMSCKTQWDDADCDKKLGNFMHTKYRVHRKFMLFEGEKAKIPETMTAVENYLNVNKWQKEVKELDNNIETLYLKLVNVRTTRNTLVRNIDIVKKGGDPDGKKKEEEEKKFVRACPDNDCKGYLSSQWKCAVCKIEVCNECLEVKEEEHECNENTLATAKALKKDSKPCPGCSSLIFKISGCDQMWCTQCHISFSWKSGKQVNGVVHNPHYYQWARETGGAAIQQPGAAGPCGGLPQFHQFIGIMKTYSGAYTELIRYGKFFTEFSRRMQYKPEKCQKWFEFIQKMWNNYPLEMTLIQLLENLFSLHESVSHFIHQEINRLREACQRQVDNKLLRIKYITNEKDEKAMKTTLLRRDNLFKKKNAMLQIYELAGQIFTEAIISTTQNPKASNIYKQMGKCEKLRKYCNVELGKVSQIYKQRVNYIEANGRTHNYGGQDDTTPVKKLELLMFETDINKKTDLLDDKEQLERIRDESNTFYRELAQNEHYGNWNRLYGRYQNRRYRNY